MALIPRRPVHETLKVDDVKDGIAGWIHSCITSKDHDGCVYDGKPKLPTRVLDVGKLYDIRVKPYSAGADEMEDYIALGYCWGEPQPLTTRGDNLEELVQGIESLALPLNLQDVITTRRLGFRYLWIDARCIIQDNDQDKRNEISRMAKTYPQRNYHSCRIVHRQRFAWLLTVSDSGVFCEYHRHNQRASNSGSRRRIPGGRLYAPDLRLHTDVQEVHRNNGDGWIDTTYFAEIWESAVVQFTLRALSMADDRLPGVQRLANEIAEHLENTVGGTYTAGIWTGCLPRLLLWSRSDVVPMGLLRWDARWKFRS